MSRSFGISVRRRYYRWRALRTTKEVNKLIESGYNPRKDPKSPYYEGAVRSKNPKPCGIDYGDTKYALVETANYLRGRRRW